MQRQGTQDLIQSFLRFLRLNEISSYNREFLAKNVKLLLLNIISYEKKTRRKIPKLSFFINQKIQILLSVKFPANDEYLFKQKEVGQKFRKVLSSNVEFVEFSLFLMQKQTLSQFHQYLTSSLQSVLRSLLFCTQLFVLVFFVYSNNQFRRQFANGYFLAYGLLNFFNFRQFNICRKC